MSTQANGPIAAPNIDRGQLGNLPPTLYWEGGEDGHLVLVDQTVLPHQVEMKPCPTVEDVWEAIKMLRVRGAPAIGVAAAYGLCIGTRSAADADNDAFFEKLNEVAVYLHGCRPTAVNLRWALQRLQDVAQPLAGQPTREIWRALLREAHTMAAEDAETCRQIGEHGAPLVPEGGGVLTHCNAGALATVAWGTALSVMYVAHQQGKRFKVFADETRPLLQGARLTAFELNSAGLDVTVLCDGAAATLLASGRVQMVVTGADRIAANGDAANKIGTYGVALAAKRHNVPFYIAAPRSTFDRTLTSGAQIPIEERDEREVAAGFGRATVPPGVPCFNPAFDVTPAELITGLITEVGLVQPVTTTNIEAIFA
jgi:methylthioribose-1-phosphate isomerase